jgi:adenosylcobyric acid synthase
MLGERLDSHSGVDGSATGLGLLPLQTEFRTAKSVTRTESRFRDLPEHWSALEGMPLAGYEIRHGKTQMTGQVTAALPDGLGFVAGPVLAIYLHGMFEHKGILRALVGEAPTHSLEDCFERLADAAEEHLDLQSLLDQIGVS